MAGGHAWQEACMAVGGMHGGGMHDRGCVWHGGGRQWTVRILLECLLVINCNTIKIITSKIKRTLIKK